MKTGVSRIVIFVISINFVLLASSLLLAQDIAPQEDAADDVASTQVSDGGQDTDIADNTVASGGGDSVGANTGVNTADTAVEDAGDKTDAGEVGGEDGNADAENADAADDGMSNDKPENPTAAVGDNRNARRSVSDTEDADSEGDTDDSRPGFFRKLAKKSKREIKARVFGYYKFSDQPGDHNQFELDVARLNFSYRHGRAMEAVFEYDFSNLVDADDVKDGLRDAYVRLEPIRAIGIQLGQFKKPFSRLELMSRRRLPTVTRGESNEYALEFLHYGGRDLGAMVSGRLIKKIKLDYYAGIFNGGGTDNVDLGSNSLDYAFRVDAKPVKWLEVGAAASIHNVREDDYSEFFDPYAYEGLVDDDFPVWLNNTSVVGYGDYAMAQFAQTYPWLSGKHWQAEIDAAVKFGNFEASLETMLGENWWFKDAPYLWSVTGLLSYKFPFFGGAMAVEPALFAEMLYIEDKDWTWRVRMMQLTPGVNVHFGDDVRLMIHGQLVRTTGVEADIDEAPLAGFWPGEWPGSFSGYKNLFIQLAFAN